MTATLSQRPLTLDRDPIEAARVTHFMDVPEDGIERGEWRIVRFEIDERASQMEELKASVKALKHGGVGGNHWTRPGTYTTLHRRKTEEEIARHGGPPHASVWLPVMSDTYNELDGHSHAIEHATGRVLVHGLGLGCIVSALIEKPDVEHIDVVEVDADVIALVGPVYANHPKVTIHHGSCVAMDWPPNARWDYVWHDIWTFISSRNLHDDEAEHGISYGRLLQMFKDRCDMQMAWAYPQAHEMDVQERRENKRADELAARFNAAKPLERIDMLVEQMATTPLGKTSVDAMYWLLTKDQSPHGKRLIDNIRRRAHRTDPMDRDEALLVLGLEEW